MCSDGHAIPTELLLGAYSQGFFPMADPETGDLEWYRPDPRAIIELKGLRVSRSLARTIRTRAVDVRTDTCFEAVVDACGRPAPGREATWLDARIKAACLRLHAEGFAHSVEAWRDGTLVGGLYGVRLGGAFFGESMFCRPECGGTDASKICLVWLVEHLQSVGGSLLDVQFMTDHLRRLGATEITDSDYQERLQVALRQPIVW